MSRERGAQWVVILVLCCTQCALAAFTSSFVSRSMVHMPYSCLAEKRSPSISMKASKKKQSKPVPPVGGKEKSGTNKEPAASSAAPVQRVDPKLGHVKAQIRWMQMKKEASKRHQQSYRREKTKFRKLKEDEPEYVEEIDLSKVHVTKVMPTLLVDGYNIIMFWSKLKKRMEQGQTERARDLLLQELQELSVMRGWTVKIIFDAQHTEALTATRTKVGANLETVYTAKDMTADQYIERETQLLKQSGCPSVMVATGDSIIRTIASAHGAQVMSPAKVVQEIKIARRESVAISTHRLAVKRDAGTGMAAWRISDCIDPALKRKLLGFGREDEEQSQAGA